MVCLHAGILQCCDNPYRLAFPQTRCSIFGRCCQRLSLVAPSPPPLQVATSTWIQQVLQTRQQLHLLVTTAIDRWSSTTLQQRNPCKSPRSLRHSTPLPTVCCHQSTLKKRNWKRCGERRRRARWKLFGVFVRCWDRTLQPVWCRLQLALLQPAPHINKSSRVLAVKATGGRSITDRMADEEKVRARTPTSALWLIRTRDSLRRKPRNKSDYSLCCSNASLQKSKRSLQSTRPPKLYAGM